MNESSNISISGSLAERETRLKKMLEDKMKALSRQKEGVDGGRSVNEEEGAEREEEVARIKRELFTVQVRTRIVQEYAKPGMWRVGTFLGFLEFS